MPHTIRKLTPSDIAPAQSLFRWFQEDDGEQPTRAADVYIAQLLARPSFHVVVAFDAEGNVIGGLTAYEMPMYKEEATELFLYEVGVDERYRRQGIARRLIQFTKELAAGRGIGLMYVGAMQWNQPALQLYASTGGRADTPSVWFDYDLAQP